MYFTAEGYLQRPNIIEELYKYCLNFMRICILCISIPIPDVPLHEDFDNFQNIWTRGSMDRLLLGLCNQMSQRRDEFVCDELSNRLFQPKGGPFGMDLAAVNIQRGRDHGLPPYTSWRIPCGLTEIQNWRDLEKVG